MPYGFSRLRGVSWWSLMMTPALISVGVLARVGTIPEVTYLLEALNALS